MGVAPLLHARLAGPALVVQRVAALEDHPVDAGGAAEHLAAGVDDAAAVHGGLGVGLVLPVVEAVADRDRQRGRHVDERVDAPVGAAGLEDQDAGAGVGGEAVGERAAGGTAADDHHVVPVSVTRRSRRTTTCTDGRMLCQTCLVSRYSARPCSPELAADAGLLVAAPLGLRDVRVVVVDPDRAHPQPGRDALGLAGVLGPDRAGQAVLAVVGDPDGLVLAGERLDRQHRAEGLVLGDRHVAAAAVEDGGQVVEAVGVRRVVGRLAPAPQHRALGQAGGDVRRDLVAVPGADEGAGLGLLVERPAEPDQLRPLDEGVDERVVDRLLDDQARAGGADLAGVQEDRGEGVVEGDVDVGVREDDVGVLAAELEGDLLHRRRGRGHDRAAGLQAAGEGDQVDARVARPAGHRPRGRRRAPGCRRPSAGRPPRGCASGGCSSTGVSSLGLSTKVLPAARQGATFQEACRSG